MHFRFDKGSKPGEEHYPLTPEQSHVVTRVRLAEWFGWSLEYIDSLSYDDVIQIFAVKTADMKAQKKHDGKGPTPKPRPGRRRRR